MKIYKKLLAMIVSLVLVVSCVPTITLVASADSGEYISPTDLPAIYINLDDNFPQDQIDKETYRPAKVSVVGAAGYADMIETVGSIKGRGNYSWSAEKKPYALKFDKKTDLLGMGKAKKWVLIANYWDKTMLRNYITLKMAADLGLDYTPEVAFVDLYINNVYRGNYLLTEKIEISSERVNIDDQNGGVLFEIEQQYRHTDCTYCYETANGVHMTYKEPELKPEDGFTENFINNMMSTTNSFLDRLDASLSQGYGQYSRFIDVESFVDWYIVNEFCKNFDSQFVTSCYCYFDPVDGKLHMGPVWDYDTCYGNQSANGYGVPEGFLISEGAPWYRILTRDSNFSRLVSERWTALKADGTIFSVMENIINGAELIAESQVLNDQTWPNMLQTDGPRGDWNMVYKTYKEEVDYLRKFVAIRTLWLDEQWNTAADSTLNVIDNINTICYGLLIDSSMAVDPSYYTTAYEMYIGLSEQEAALLDPVIKNLFEEQQVFAVESAIRNAANVTMYSQKNIVEYARELYESLSDDKKELVTNYQDLLDAEAKIVQFMADMGIANVLQNNVTDMVISESIAGSTGFAPNESVQMLFDGDTGTKLCTGDPFPVTVEWKMESPIAVTVYAFCTANDFPGRRPKAWTLEGSNDDVNWKVVDTVTESGLSEEPFKYKEFFVDTAVTYSNYRVLVTDTYDGTPVTQWSEILLGGQDNQAVVAVVDAIDALGTVTSLSQKAAVDAVRALYEALSDADRMYVSNYSELIAAEAVILQLEGQTLNAERVAGIIAALPDEVSVSDENQIVSARNEYDNLTAAEKTLIDNYGALTAAEAKLAEAKELAADIAAAAEVDAMISEIGEVTSASQGEQIKAARAAYNALTSLQKGYVGNLELLVKAETALSQLDALPAIIEIIASISENITHRDGPAVRAAREMYDNLSASDKAKVNNIGVLTAAEAVLNQLYDAFDVEVISSIGGRTNYTKTPWLSGGTVSQQDETASLTAMSDELFYQYKMKGYQMGVTTGIYELSDNNGYMILQSDLRYTGGSYDVADIDNVGDPWGSGRYWACVISPFAGMAFSVNGYMSASTYGYEMPLSDSFVYNGKVYQVYSSGVRYHEDTPLVKGTSPAFATFEYYPGSGDQTNNNTFAYAYAKYSQDNKWDNLVVGIPYGNVETSANGEVKYQKFYSASGDAYVAGQTSDINAADPNSGRPEGAFIISGDIAAAFSAVADTDAERFAITGAPVSNMISGDGYCMQNFQNGTVVAYGEGIWAFITDSPAEADVAAAIEVYEKIAALPAFDNMDEDSFAAAEELYSEFEDLSDGVAALIPQTAVNKLERAITWKRYQIILGDLDGNNVINVLDVVALRMLIMSGGHIDGQMIMRGDVDGNGTLTVGDVVALRLLIMS